MKLFFILINTLTAWAVFLIADYVQEVTGSYWMMLLATYLTMAVIIYEFAYLQKSSLAGMQSIDIVLFLLTWSIIWFVSAIPIIYAVFNGRWIIEQGRDGLLGFLNGIEYLIFTFTFIFFVEITIIIRHISNFITKYICEIADEDDEDDEEEMC